MAGKKDEHSGFFVAVVLIGATVLILAFAINVLWSIGSGIVNWRRVEPTPVERYYAPDSCYGLSTVECMLAQDD